MDGAIDEGIHFHLAQYRRFHSYTWQWTWWEDLWL